MEWAEDIDDEDIDEDTDDEDIDDIDDELELLSAKAGKAAIIIDNPTTKVADLRI